MVFNSWVGAGAGGSLPFQVSTQIAPSASSCCSARHTPCSWQRGCTLSPQAVPAMCSKGPTSIWATMHEILCRNPGAGWHVRHCWEKPQNQRVAKGKRRQSKQ